MGRGDSTKVGRQDKRTAPKVAVSLCLHIEKHGTTGGRDGAIVGRSSCKALNVLGVCWCRRGGTAWQAVDRGSSIARSSSRLRCGCCFCARALLVRGGMKDSRAPARRHEHEQAAETSVESI